MSEHTTSATPLDPVTVERTPTGVHVWLRSGITQTEDGWEAEETHHVLPPGMGDEEAVTAAATRAATLTDLTARIEVLEAALVTENPAPGEDADAPLWADLPLRAGHRVWSQGGLLTDGGVVYKNVSGTLLTEPPSRFPGDPSMWGHLFVPVTTGTGPSDPNPETPAPAPWDKDATYDAGDTCTKDGRVWECLHPHGPERQGTWAPGPATPTIWRDLGPAT